MDIKELKLSEVKPYEKNPRKNDNAVKYVAESIKEFGFKVPLVIDRNGVIVAGHTRYKAAKHLKMKTVPCLVADDLTDEQVRAFRLADNKVAEQAEWDGDLLDEELADILDIDMSMFGFDSFLPKETEENEEYYGAERERTFNAYNLHDVDENRLSEKWQMPTLKKCTHIPKDLIGFKYAKAAKPEEYKAGIHFFIDDYQFERIWNAPHDYIDLLKRFDCVCTPDFSLYTEMPLPMQIWNVYRSRMVGQIMQDYGLQVIPTLQWCKEESFDFCFDGIEKGTVVAVSTIGVKEQDEGKRLWFSGMEEALDQIKPKCVIVYGGDIGFDFEKTKVVYIANHQLERQRGKNEN